MSDSDLGRRMRGNPTSGAWISEDEVYRHALWRNWNAALPILLIGGLNPSTADHQKNDPTILREIGFATRLGFGGILKVNAYDYRTSSPVVLRIASTPASGWNADAHRQAADICKVALMAYGNDAGSAGPEMAMRIAGRGCATHVLALTASGQPRHTLARGKHRIDDDAPLIPWSPLS